MKHVPKQITKFSFQPLSVPILFVVRVLETNGGLN